MINYDDVEKTELVWPGKKTEVERIELPFQVIETINESKTDRQQNLLFRQNKKHPKGWINKLIWGDNKLVMSSLMKEFAGKIDLIYIDPPFMVGANFKAKIKIREDAIGKEHSTIEEIAYTDTWGKGYESYLQMMYERLLLIKDLLSEKGSIYIHLDWHVSHYVKIILDHIFGEKNFLNDIIWSYRRWPANSKNFQRMHDNILFYSKSKSKERIFNILYEPLAESTMKADGGYKILNVIDKNGKRIRGKKTGEKSPGTPQRDVFDISFISATGSERTGYNTQKPEKLLERIIKASSNEGDLVVDFFCGSGTTLATAEKLGRRWIGCDLGKYAIHITRKRLLEIENCHPFEILNLGKYQRQYWQIGLSKDKEKARIEYINLILKLYKAKQMAGSQYIHGTKRNRLVHIGAVDCPITDSEVNECIVHCIKLGGDKLDILGWEYEMGDLAEVKELVKQKGVKLNIFKIPNDIVSKDLTELGEVQFLEMGNIELDIKTSRKHVSIKIKDFIFPHLDLINEKDRKKIKKWQDVIDYWAIDWNYNNDTFHNEWQDFKTRKDAKISWTVKHEYNKPGDYNIMVKVIDILGNDTTVIKKVKIR